MSRPCGPMTSLATSSDETSPLPTEVVLNGTFLPRPSGPLGSLCREYQAAHPILALPAHLELILDTTSTLLPFHFLRTGDRLGRAVVKILRGDGGSGTGFLVAPGLLLTNHHVLPEPGVAASAIALANYESAPPGATLGRPASVPLDPDTLFVTNSDLDFTFCAVRGLDFLGSITLDRSGQNIGPSETVNIIQHPRGRPKEVAIKDNRIVKADPVVIHYACSTEPGSSGSPVFNNQWQPVALHHASVVSDGPEARTPLATEVAAQAHDAPSSQVGATRYLNEGIRLSAIALWLETAEANAHPVRDQVARIRAIFHGIDPQVGFFGALGRKAHGRRAPDVVLESYGGETDDLDLAFWNLHGLATEIPALLSTVGRVVAEMGMDLWCLSHIDDQGLATLREHLSAHAGLDYEFFHEPAGVYPPLALLYRRSKALAVERRGWGFELPDGVELPPLVTVRAATRRCGTVAFQLVPVVRPVAAESWSAPYAEAVRHVIRHRQGELDWIILGESAVVLAPERLHVLADSDRDLLAAASERDGAAALLTTHQSKIGQVFVSPNLRPAFGVPETLTVTRDRDLPPALNDLGQSQPVALRLTLESEPRPVAGPVPFGPLAVDTNSPLRSGRADPFAAKPGPTLTDSDLERRIRDLLAPILAQLLAGSPNRPHDQSQPSG